MRIDERAEDREYPLAPWSLGGWGIATVGLVDATAVLRYIPSGARLVTVMPGKTIGGLFFFSYERGALVYRELNVVAGLIRIGLRFAFLLPRLYVDSAASLIGGRDLWALPKELARFDTSVLGTATAIRVRQAEREVCRLTCETRGPRVRVPFAFPLPSVGIRDDAFLFFTGALWSTFTSAQATVEMPLDSEFTSLHLDRPLTAFRCDDLTLRIPAAKAVPRSSKKQAGFAAETLI